MKDPQLRDDPPRDAARRRAARARRLRDARHAPLAQRARHRRRRSRALRDGAAATRCSSARSTCAADRARRPTSSTSTPRSAFELLHAPWTRRRRARARSRRPRSAPAAPRGCCPTTTSRGCPTASARRNVRAAALLLLTLPGPGRSSTRATRSAWPTGPARDRAPDDRAGPRRPPPPDAAGTTTRRTAASRRGDAVAAGGRRSTGGDVAAQERDPDSMLAPVPRPDRAARATLRGGLEFLDARGRRARLPPRRRARRRAQPRRRGPRRRPPAGAIVLRHTHAARQPAGAAAPDARSQPGEGFVARPDAPVLAGDRSSTVRFVRARAGKPADVMTEAGHRRCWRSPRRSLAVAACGGSGSQRRATVTLSWFIFNEPSGGAQAPPKPARSSRTASTTSSSSTSRRRPTSSASSSSAASAPRTTRSTCSAWTSSGPASSPTPAGSSRCRPRSRPAVTENVFDSVLQTARFKNRLYAVPIWSNTQLLWYRKDRVAEPPKTWDEMINEAEKLGPAKGQIQVQANRYEGLVVLVNALIESAGTSILAGPEQIALDKAKTERALAVLGRLAHSPVAAAEHRHLDRGHRAPGLRVGQLDLHDQLPLRLSVGEGQRARRSSRTCAPRSTRRSTRASRPSRRSAGSTSASRPTPSTRRRRSTRSSAWCKPENQLDDRQARRPAARPLGRLRPARDREGLSRLRERRSATRSATRRRARRSRPPTRTCRWRSSDARAPDDAASTRRNPGPTYDKLRDYVAGRDQPRRGCCERRRHRRGPAAQRVAQGADLRQDARRAQARATCSARPPSS